jgi:galactan endo-1,6-beta-galactosidase
MIHLAALLIAQTTVTIDPATKLSTWEGWGTSLCWLGNAFGGREDLADLLFTTKTVTIGDAKLPGLGMTIVRYNAGACGPGEVDGRSMVLSKSVLPFRQIEGLWLDPTKGEAGWDWNRDKAQRAMMLNAKKRGANKFELFSNSPMWWMCVNANPSGAEKATDDNLRPDMHEAFATYLATIAAQSPKRWGVKFTSVEPFNEPASDYWSAKGRQEGCHFSPATQAAFLPILRRELDRQGLRKLAIAASDETSFSHAVSTWNAFDDKTKALIDQANVHGYEQNESKRAAYAAALGNKPRWNSEHGDGDASGVSTARGLSMDLNVLRVSAWCYWQPLDGGGWGFLDCDMPSATVKGPNPKLFVIAQYTRHIRPGMAILATGDPHVVAAYDARRKRLVVVAVGAKEPASKSLDLSAFNLDRRKAARWTTMPKGTERYDRGADLDFEGSSLQLDLPAASVQTLELNGVTIRKVGS